MKVSDVAQLYRNLGRPVPREFSDPREMRSKYGAWKKEIDGMVFASTGEAEAYQILKLRERAGFIRELTCQPIYVLQPAFEGRGRKHRSVTYRADFRFLDAAGQVNVIDFKGMRTEAYRIKAKLFQAKYPDIIFTEWDRNTLRSML